MTCPRCWGVSPFCDLCQKMGKLPDVQLTEHFKLSEFLQSQTAVQHRISNAPTPEHVASLKALCIDLLEPLRLWAGPIRVTSGLRLPTLNKAVGGSSNTSAHQTGNAADLNPLKKTIKECMEWLRNSTLKYDQIIYEGTWLHVGRLNPLDQKQRLQALMMFPEKGKPVYAPYDPRDVRVV